MSTIWWMVGTVNEWQQLERMTFWLLVSHAVCDFALQNDFVAQAKNPATAFGRQFWYWVLPAHALIHAGGVALVTGSVMLGAVEFVLHAVIDYVKCTRRISFNCDQTLHVLCKLTYVAFLVAPSAAIANSVLGAGAWAIATLLSLGAMIEERRVRRLPSEYDQE
jgi:hypothetical protein